MIVVIMVYYCLQSAAWNACKNVSLDIDVAMQDQLVNSDIETTNAIIFSNMLSFILRSVES